MAFDKTSGVVKWQKFIGDNTTGGIAYGTSIAVDDKGNVIIIGQNDNSYALVTKLKGSNGSLVWQSRDESQNNWDDAPCGVVDYNGDVYLGGSYYNNNYGCNVGSITKLSGKTGNLVWTKSIRNTVGNFYTQYETSNQYVEFSNGEVQLAGYAYNSNNNYWDGFAVSIPMNGACNGTYDRFIIDVDTYGSGWQNNTSQAAVNDPTTPFAPTNGVTVYADSPYIELNNWNDSYDVRYNMTTGLPGIVFGDGSEIAHPGIARALVDNGDSTIYLDSTMNGKFLYFNDNPNNWNSTISIAPNVETPLPIGYTVTVVIGNFNSTAVIYVNGNVGFFVSGSNNFNNQYWTFGGDGKAGVYTIMKVDTDQWMLTGPNIQVD